MKRTRDILNVVSHGDWFTMYARVEMRSNAASRKANRDLPPSQGRRVAVKILVVHNYYQQPGGEDRVFEDESELLASHGHEVVKFAKHNDSVKEMSSWSLAARTIWNSQVAREIGELVRSHRADIVHFHNTLPLISPAAYYAARQAGAAVVQTLHNYRLACPKSTFFREGAPCESCLGKAVAWPAVLHGCYRDSRAATATVAAMLGVHRLRGTYRKAVDAYIALTQFAREKMIEAGLPAEKLHLRPNYMLDDPGAGSGNGEYALFLGRLSPEKGIATMLDAWQRYDPGVPLVICGDGPLAPEVEQAATRSDRIKWLPRRPHAELLERLGRASLLVVPSQWYEGFPKTIVEAYSKGTPVVASRLGSMVELIDDGVTGAKFTPGNAVELAATVRQTLENKSQLERMRVAARHKFETCYSAVACYERLLEIYEAGLRVRHGAAVAITSGSVPSTDQSIGRIHNSASQTFLEACPR